MGNWDKAGAWIVAKVAGSLTAVMERVKPESAPAGQPQLRLSCASYKAP